MTTYPALRTQRGVAYALDVPILNSQTQLRESVPQNLACTTKYVDYGANPIWPHYTTPVSRLSRLVHLGNGLWQFQGEAADAAAREVVISITGTNIRPYELTIDCGPPETWTEVYQDVTRCPKGGAVHLKDSHVYTGRSTSPIDVTIPINRSITIDPHNATFVITHPNHNVVFDIQSVILSEVEWDGAPGVNPLKGDTHLTPGQVLTGLSDGEVVLIRLGQSPSDANEEHYVRLVRILSVNQKQRVITGGATGGTFTLTFSGQTTAAIAYNATTATVQAALEALSNIAVGDVAVSHQAGISATTGTWLVEFKGAFLQVNQALMTINGAGLTGGAPAVNEHYKALQLDRPIEKKVTATAGQKNRIARLSSLAENITIREAQYDSAMAAQNDFPHLHIRVKWARNVLYHNHVGVGTRFIEVVESENVTGINARSHCHDFDESYHGEIVDMWGSHNCTFINHEVMTDKADGKLAHFELQNTLIRFLNFAGHSIRQHTSANAVINCGSGINSGNEHIIFDGWLLNLLGFADIGSSRSGEFSEIVRFLRGLVRQPDFLVRQRIFEDLAYYNDQRGQAIDAQNYNCLWKTHDITREIPLSATMVNQIFQIGAGWGWKALGFWTNADPANFSKLELGLESGTYTTIHDASGTKNLVKNGAYRVRGAFLDINPKGAASYNQSYIPQRAAGQINSMEWAASVAYITSPAADVVLNGGNRYICLLAHTSDAAKEPGTGADWATYWNAPASSQAIKKF